MFVSCFVWGRFSEGQFILGYVSLLLLLCSYTFDPDAIDGYSMRRTVAGTCFSRQLEVELIKLRVRVIPSGVPPSPIPSLLMTRTFRTLYEIDE